MEPTAGANARADGEIRERMQRRTLQSIVIASAAKQSSLTFFPSINVIASAPKQSSPYFLSVERWIASSQAPLAMTL
jgi:hypothetical protein